MKNNDLRMRFRQSFSGLLEKLRPLWSRDTYSAGGNDLQATYGGLSVSVTRLLFMLVACSVLGMFALIGYGKWQMERVYQNTYTNIRTTERIGDIRDIRAHVSRLRMLLYQHAINEDPQAEAQLDQRIGQTQDAIQVALHDYEASLADATDADMLQADKTLLEKYLQHVPQMMRYTHDGNANQALTLLREQTRNSDDLSAALDTHVRYSSDLGTHENERLSSMFTSSFWVSVFFVITVVTILLALGYTISRRLMQQVEQMKVLGRQSVLFHNMVEMMNDVAIMLHDPKDDHRTLYANTTACRHFGVDREVLLNWRPLDWDAEVTPFRLNQINALVRELQAYTFESMHRTTMGELVPVEVVLSRFEHEGEELFVSVSRDISMRKEAEARQREYERNQIALDSAGRLARFAESAPGMMFSYHARPDEHGVLRGYMPYVSRGIRDVYGVSPEDVRQDISPLEALTFPEDLPNIRAAAQVSREQLTPLAAAFRIRHPAKGERWLQARCMPAVLDDGSVQWHGFIYDITERKQLEEKLRESEGQFRTLVENSPDMIVRYDLDCRRIFVNPAYRQITGSIIQLEGEALGQAWRPENISAEEFKAQLDAVAKDCESRDILVEWRSEHGQLVSHVLRVVPEYDTDDKVISLLGIGHNISRLRAAEYSLRQRERYLRAVLDNFPFYVWLKDTESRMLAVNVPLALKSGATSPEELEGKTDFEIYPHELASQYVADDREVLASGKPKNLEELFCDEIGEFRWVETYKSPVTLDGEVIGTVGFARDITDKKQMALELERHERELRTLIENTPDTITRFDHNCRRIFANTPMAALSGLALNQLLGTKPTEFPGGASAKGYEEAIHNIFEKGEPDSYELIWNAADGRNLCTHIRLMPEFDGEGQVVSVLAVGRDISEIDAYRQRIHRLAFFDSLTELPNRELLMDRIRHTIAGSSWHGHQFGLMLLDLDHFKEVNDTLGHGVGDLLLREVADRLLDCVRSYDTVARLGGDEFSILLPEVRGGEDLATIARKIISALEQPFDISNRELFISASIGIALYPIDSAEIDALFKYADSAMYYAKKQGRNNFQYYSRDLTARSTERMQLESALRKAGKRGELELYYQPQVDLVTHEIVGAEALLRWNHRDHGMITPDKFIPVAEETGLIVGIGEWILTSACRAAVAWNTGRSQPLKVAVNLSTRQFQRNDLLGSLRGILMETECNPAWLKLEITESLLLEDSRDIVAILEELDAMGLAISIDDFGTGYSALSYLNQFPVSQIKIDRSFVHGIPEERDKSELVKAMISIAQSLRLELVAEGVETSQQADYLNSHGCRLAQGYLFGKPMPQHEFEAKLGLVVTQQ